MRFFVTLLGTTLLCGGAMAAGYSEARSGDLSNDGLNPTPVKTKLGASIIDGNDGASGGVIDRDYFTIRVPAGQVLASITLDKSTQVGGTFSFIGIQKGRQVTVDPNGTSAAGLLGWTHYSMGDIGTDLLPAICNGGDGATGCTPPLKAGIYSFWAQELSTCSCHYRFTINLATAAEDDASDEEAAGTAP
jgi:hypothetical protein